MPRNAKLKTIEEVAEAIAPLRPGKKVVHCHGVFDLLHIGHIRHFEQARALGDVLVVTVTPDRHVNKGPGRPAFSEDLRVEAIAALGCVDHVALNRWPTAEEAIRLLRPDVFAKGAEYKDGKDRTGAISVEEEAVRSVGGRLALTEDIAFSSSSLINRHIVPTQNEAAAEFLADFTARHRSEDILRWLEDVRSSKVFAVGEAIIDEYQYCEAIGKSSKEPMIAVRHLSTERFAGGILAVGNHVANFCDQVGLVSFLGKENSQEDFIRQRLSPRIDARFLHRAKAPTIVKRRLIESYFFTKLMEVYEIDGELNPEDDERLCTLLEEMLPRFDVVMVVDYGHSMLSERAVKVLCERSRFLAVNAQTNAGNYGFHTISKYPRADYVCITEKEMRLETRDRWGDLKDMVVRISGKLDCPKMTVTRGSHGCLAYDRAEGFHEIPAFAGKVVDRMGAGDSVIATTAPIVAAGAPMEVVGFIGNCVGAQAVATVGHRKATERVPLFRHIECLMK